MNEILGLTQDTLHLLYPGKQLPHNPIASNSAGAILMPARWALFL